MSKQIYVEFYCTECELSEVNDARKYECPRCESDEVVNTEFLICDCGKRADADVSYNKNPNAGPQIFAAE